MRSVRCDVCGTKALMAASQCPKCSHLFELRDGFGAALPLSYCSNCDSYYPETAGSCRWCGTLPEPAPNIPLIWKRVGAGSLVVLVALAWLLRDSKPKPASPANSVATYVTGDTTASGATVVDSTASRVTTASGGNVERPTAPSKDSRGAVAPQAAPTPGPAAASAAPSAASKSKPSSRWVASIAKGWIVVRADARKDARIIASIGPNTRVQLGESRGAWRRIKAKGIAGWVEEARSSFATAAGPAEVTGLAAR